ncbi:unnamed protein product [Anisakis simplex]|uniref:Uncharacterized protein n=1 Tax=Anisakis simplex TaxID=6269 RepID=A0A0M3JQI7_ANISI|nr:unnamed protein product [Anisakis simplex]
MIRRICLKMKQCSESLKAALVMPKNRNITIIHHI